MQNENVFFTTDKYSNLTDEQTISQIKQLLDQEFDNNSNKTRG